MGISISLRSGVYPTLEFILSLQTFAAFTGLKAFA
jgi:hypothetical protein